MGASIGGCDGRFVCRLKHGSRSPKVELNKRLVLQKKK